jgi:hypothetical protein
MHFLCHARFRARENPFGAITMEAYGGPETGPTGRSGSREVGWSVRRGSEWDEIMDERRGFPRVAVTAAVCERALAVQGLLAGRGQHRAASIPDLLVAAAAEAAGLVVLHYDADFDALAAVTGQPVQWVVPRGTVT